MCTARPFPSLLPPPMAWLSLLHQPCQHLLPIVAVVVAFQSSGFCKEKNILKRGRRMNSVLGAAVCHSTPSLFLLHCGSIGGSHAPRMRSSSTSGCCTVGAAPMAQKWGRDGRETSRRMDGVRRRSGGTGWGGSSAQVEPLDLTEENVEQVLLDARSELLQLFDTSVGITGVAELVELDGPFVKLRLTGRFWHERSMVLARLANYLQKRIPEIAEVEIEDESQLDDSAANF